MDDGGGFEDVAIGDDEGGEFAFFDRSEEVIDAEDLCGSKGDAVERGLWGEAVGDGDRGGVWEVAFVTESGGHGERPLDSGVIESLRECVAGVVWGVGPLGELVGASDDDRGVGGCEEVGAEVCVVAADDDGAEVAGLGPVD